MIDDSCDTLSLKIDGVDTDIKFPHGYYDYGTFRQLLEELLIEYLDLFAMYSAKVYQSVPVFSVNTEKPFTINKASSTIQNYKWFEWLKYSIPANNSGLGLTENFSFQMMLMFT